MYQYIDIKLWSINRTKHLISLSDYKMHIQCIPETPEMCCCALTWIFTFKK